MNCKVLFLRKKLNIMNKKLLLFLGLLLNLSIVNAQQFTVDGIKYKVTDVDAKTVEIIQNSCYDGIGDLILNDIVIYNDINYTLTSIGSLAFDFCENLNKITFPRNITKIGSSAFYGCTNLTSISLPENLTTIEASAFYFCGNLTSVTLNEKLNNIEGTAFGRCNKLETIYTKVKNPFNLTLSVFEDLFDGTYVDLSLIDLVVSVGSKSAYEVQNVWKNFKSITEDSTLSTKKIEFTTEGFALNITAGELKINNSKNIAIESVVVYNTLGKEVKNSLVPTLNITDLTSGIYIVAIKTSNGIATKKFVKE